MADLEGPEQVKVVRYLEARDDLDAWLAVVNEGKRSKRTAMRYKRQGLRPGVWDLLILETTLGGLKGLAIEMKAPRHPSGRPRNDLTQTQREWKARYTQADFATAGPCHGAAEAIDAIDEHYGSSPRDRLNRAMILGDSPSTKRGGAHG